MKMIYIFEAGNIYSDIEDENNYYAKYKNCNCYNEYMQNAFGILMSHLSNDMTKYLMILIIMKNAKNFPKTWF